MAETPRPRVLVVYYSATGNVATLAHEIADGAASAGAEVRCRRVAETAPEDAIATNPTWQAYLARTDLDEIATLADVTWADGLALGSPTRFGGPASQFKAFLDTTGGLWMKGKLLNKVCTAFTSASTHHGGLESTILAINNHCYHWGSIIVPLGYPDRHILKTTGNPYGASFVSQSGASPDADSRRAARTQGERFGQIVAQIVRGREAFIEGQG